LTAANNLPVDTPPFPLNTTFKYNSPRLPQSGDRGHWQHKMRIDQRRLETGLKMSSKGFIIAFTILGVFGYLITFLVITLATPDAIGTWKIAVGSIGGAVFIGLLIVVVLRFSRYLLIKLAGLNMDIK